MKQLFTPLLRRAYAVFALICAVHFAWPSVMRSEWNRERLLRVMLAATEESVREHAAVDLMRFDGEVQLLAALREPSVAVRHAATGALLQLWFNRGGADELGLLERAQALAEKNDLRRALVVLNHVTRVHPLYAAGWDFRATVHWKMGNLRKAEQDCRKVVVLNPNHYAAWRSLGVCQMSQGRLAEASKSLRQALLIAPEDRVSRSYFRRCGEIKSRIRGRSGTDLLNI